MRHYQKCKLNCCSVTSFVQSLSPQFWFIRQPLAGDNSKSVIKKWKGAFFTALQNFEKKSMWGELFENLLDLYKGPCYKTSLVSSCNSKEKFCNEIFSFVLWTVGYYSFVKSRFRKRPFLGKFLNKTALYTLD